MSTPTEAPTKRARHNCHTDYVLVIDTCERGEYFNEVAEAMTTYTNPTTEVCSGLRFGPTLVEAMANGEPTTRNYTIVELDEFKDADDYEDLVTRELENAPYPTENSSVFFTIGERAVAALLHRSTVRRYTVVDIGDEDVRIVTKAGLREVCDRMRMNRGSDDSIVFSDEALDALIMWVFDGEPEL